jgi:hypothetical protein
LFGEPTFKTALYGKHVASVSRAGRQHDDPAEDTTRMKKNIAAFQIMGRRLNSIRRHSPGAASTAKGPSAQP